MMHNDNSTHFEGKAVENRWSDYVQLKIALILA